MKGQMSGQIRISDYSAKWGLKKKHLPGDLITTEGCDYDDCFSCAGTGCRIRGEERYCRYTNLGSPYSCETLKRIEKEPDSFGDWCQFIDQGLAYHREGDRQPSPCCRDCAEECENRCEKAIENREK